MGVTLSGISKSIKKMEDILIKSSNYPKMKKNIKEKKYKLPTPIIDFHKYIREFTDISEKISVEGSRDNANNFGFHGFYTNYSLDKEEYKQPIKNNIFNYVVGIFGNFSLDYDFELKSGIEYKLNVAVESFEIASEVKRQYIEGNKVKTESCLVNEKCKKLEDLIIHIDSMDTLTKEDINTKSTLEQI